MAREKKKVKIDLEPKKRICQGRGPLWLWDKQKGTEGELFVLISSPMKPLGTKAKAKMRTTESASQMCLPAAVLHLLFARLRHSL